MHRALRWTIKVVVGRRPVIDFMRSNERTTHPHLHIPQHTERERESDWERERTAPHSMESIHRTNLQRVEKWKMQIMARFCHPVMPSRSQTGRVFSQGEQWAKDIISYCYSVLFLCHWTYFAIKEKWVRPSEYEWAGWLDGAGGTGRAKAIIINRRWGRLQLF